MTCGVYGRNPKLYLNSGEMIEYDDSYTGGMKYHDFAEHGHHTYWTDAVKAGFGSDEHKALTSSFDYSGPLTEAVLMGNLAIRSYQTFTKGSGRRREFIGRRRLLWDGNAMKITNFDEANEFVSRKYRRGWDLM